MDWTIVALVLVLVLVPGLLFIWLMSDSRPRDMVRHGFNWLGDGGGRAAEATRSGLVRTAGGTRGGLTRAAEGTRGGFNRGRGTFSRGLTEVWIVAKQEIAEWRRVQHRIREHPTLATSPFIVRRRGLNDVARDRFHERWDALQMQFLDDPQKCIMLADALLRDLLHERGYSSDGGGDETGALLVGEYRALRRFAPDVPFEEQRETMLKYRSFFEQLMTDEEPRPALAARVATGNRGR
jgi:hypothetical protein